ncbi:hypothetical protein COO60DRAFT_1464031, partial [Scenedesmus sp. NREL 46B-D3]
MAGRQQWVALLLIIGALLPWQRPVAVEGACCTFGQPTYEGSEFNASSYGVTFTIATCRTNPNNNFWYNPQAGTGKFWWSTDPRFGGPYAGSGKACTISLPRWQCSIGGMNVPTCQDTDSKMQGPQPYACPQGFELDPDSSSSVLSTETCCKPLPAPSPSPLPPAVPSPGSIPGAPTCGDQRPDLPGNQTFDCKTLGDYVLNENMTDVGPPSGNLCCMPRFSCIDVNPNVKGCQPFYCDTDNGWYPNQNAHFLPNPSNEVCCLRATCADKDVFKTGKQQQRCREGTEYDPSKANVSPPSRRRCCR